MCYHSKGIIEPCAGCEDVVRLVLAGVPVKAAIAQSRRGELVQASLFDEVT